MKKKIQTLPNYPDVPIIPVVVELTPRLAETLALLERRFDKSLIDILEYWLEEERKYYPACIRVREDRCLEYCSDCEADGCPDKVKA